MPHEHTDLRADRPKFAASDLHDLLHAFQELSPERTLLIGRMKAGVSATPEHFVDRANALSAAGLNSTQTAIEDGASIQAAAGRLGAAHTALQRANA